MIRMLSCFLTWRGLLMPHDAIVRVVSWLPRRNRYGGVAWPLIVVRFRGLSGERETAPVWWPQFGEPQ